MLLINNYWDSVNDMNDVIRICSKYIGDEFAKKVEEIYKDDLDYNVCYTCDYKERVKQLEEDIGDLAELM